MMVKYTLKLAGLFCNEEKSFWNLTETKPLLGAIWSPNVIFQKPEAIKYYTKDEDNQEDFTINKSLQESCQTTHSLSTHSLKTQIIDFYINLEKVRTFLAKE
eukprot:GHVP01011325.1.p1 GENE.GHVP01011325.1~~GHVP01011325.1.p1  ORF type:complete len:102 (-),score=15.61 GHVP01011325.1:266-571(-)